jgi:ubiquitin C-terminal hydrolase
MNLEDLEYIYDIHKHYNIKQKKDVYEGKGLSTLLNIGNTCFLNSIIQCLSNTLSLTDYILSGDYKQDQTIINKKRNSNYVLQSYTVLINNIWNINNQIIKPKTFLENLSRFHKKYFSLRQQDSHECLLFIIDLLHNSLSYEIDIDIKGIIKSKSDELVKQSLETWSDFYKNDYSHLIELFNGNTFSNISCNNEKCNFNENKFEPFNTLSIDLVDDNLNSCLSHYFSLTENIETWTCDSCKEKGCTKNVKLWTVPDYLIIHLKRFSTNGDKKLLNINFPLNDLNITDYISLEKNNKNKYIYDLYSINHHSGNSSNSGHYWSSCKNLNNNWYKYDDANITKYTNNNLQQQLTTSDSYILFYQRKKIIKNPSLPLK